MAQLFPTHTEEEHTQALANLLPVGRVFASKNIDGSNFRDLLKIFAPEASRFEDAYLEVSKETDINDADVYLERWESSMGIPDECFTNTGTLEERRLNVIIKLACMNIATEADVFTVADKLGFEITIEPLAENEFPPYDIPMTPLSVPSARFIWIIRGDNIAPSFPPYTIPHFLDIGAIILNCVLAKTKPAFIELFFLNTGDPLPQASGYDEGYSSGYGPP